MSDGIELTLKISTTQTTPYMSHERRSLETEAKVLSLLSGRGIPYVPLLVRLICQQGARSNGNYLLRHSSRGFPLSEIEPSTLTVDDQMRIDRQLGSAVRLIGDHTSTCFGTIEAVSSGGGERTWKRAFILLFDSLLFEAENKLISLPLVEIQHQVARLVRALDDVLKPQLVILDVGKRSHIIIHPVEKQISGLTDFSNALWGDILLADVFEDASSSFLQGYGFDPTQEKSAHIRLLLYSCYRCLRQIVKQYFRDRNDEVELAARRTLTEKLAIMAVTTG